MRIVLDEGVPRTLAGALRTFGLDADPFDAAPGRHILMNIDGTRTVRGFEDGAVVVIELPPVATFKG